jgi:hypothetical protein
MLHASGAKAHFSWRFDVAAEQAAEKTLNTSFLGTLRAEESLFS